MDKIAWAVAAAAAATGLALGWRRLTVRGLHARLAAAETAYLALRHDLRGLLAPALMVIDPLLEHDEPAVRRAGEIVLKSVERAVERLDAR